MTALSGHELPPGHTVRAPRFDDAEAVAAVKRAVYAGHRDEEITSDSVREDWALPRMDLQCDAWVVEGPDGSLVASALVFEDLPGNFVRIHFVRPGRDDLALERHLLHLAEARVCERVTTGPGRGDLSVLAFESEHRLIDLYTSSGYRPVRTFLRMEISLEHAPAVPAVPLGIAVRPFRAGVDERAVYEATQEAFLDHWEPTELTFEEWLALECASPAGDLGPWLVAWDGDEVAGVALASTQTHDGWVEDLAVRRPWRGRGLGRALLLAAFTELRARGLTRAFLGVDTLNPTGAMGLYESAGMSKSGDAHLVFRRALTAP